MKIISLFNHKGGVSKTTTTYHLGWMLTMLKKRVLLVDADSQCNLTLTVVGQDSYEKFLKNNPDNNLRSGLLPAFESRPELIKPVDCIQVKNNERLFLLPGSFEITEFEVQLSVSFQLTSSFSILKNLPGSFNYLIRKSAQKHKIDYVLIDLNPSLSAINQDLIISSDYFILPTSPDYFSEMAIRSIGRIVPTWETWAKQARGMFKDSSYPLPDVIPKFLGYTVNDYSIRNGKPAKAFKSIIDDIDETVRKSLIPSLEKVGLLLPRQKYNDQFCLAKISNFQTLQPKFQESGLPVYKLTEKIMGSTGVVWDGQKKKISFFKDTYEEFAAKVIELTI
jgi:cellulose biosynthesis protein BcsQ